MYAHSPGALQPPCLRSCHLPRPPCLSLIASLLPSVSGQLEPLPLSGYLPQPSQVHSLSSLNPAVHGQQPQPRPSPVAFNGFSLLPPPHLAHGVCEMPPYYMVSILHCPGPGGWPQPGRQELVPAVCHVNSAKPCHTPGLCHAVPWAVNLLSFSPSPPSPAQMHPL